MMLKLVDETDPILRAPCPSFNMSATYAQGLSAAEYLRKITNQMFNIMDQHDGIGLAAPQVGLSQRFFIMYINGNKTVCVNPRIHEASEHQARESEGCLSFPGLVLKIRRPSELTAEYQEINGTIYRSHMTGLTGRCFQHELDHLDGITFDTKVAQLSLKLAKQRRHRHHK